MVLEDEKGVEHQVKYIRARGALCGGWKGFASCQNLEIGDALVFELSEPTRFKVWLKFTAWCLLYCIQGFLAYSVAFFFNLRLPPCCTQLLNSPPFLLIHQMAPFYFSSVFLSFFLIFFVSFIYNSIPFFSRPVWIVYWPRLQVYQLYLVYCICHDVQFRWPSHCFG